MNLRHAAALTLVGWYLMMPPTADEVLGRSDPGEDLVALSAPLSEWFLSQSFDTAQECERVREKKYNEGSRAMHDLLKSESHPDDSPRAQIIAQDMFNQCIATDDPRLEEK
jgi:hypothetical protein